MDSKQDLTPEEYEHLLEQKDKTIQTKDRIIDELREELTKLIDEKEEMIENFKISTGLLIEKLKDLESQRIGYRPQTANVLAKAKNEYPVPKYPRRNQNVIQTDIQLQADWEREIPESREEDKEDVIESKKCMNCNKSIRVDDFETHTIMCFRKVSTCKICGELVGANTKIQHLSEWRMPEKILQHIENKDPVKLKLSFEHGANVNHKFSENRNSSYLHIVIERGLEELLVVLVGHRANLEATDDEGNTPLLKAAQLDNYDIFKSLIDLGADIEAKNKICWNALFYVCKRGDKKMLDLLIENKVNLNTTTPLGDNCLKIAEKSGKQDISLFLINQEQEANSHRFRRRPRK